MRKNPPKDLTTKLTRTSNPANPHSAPQGDLAIEPTRRIKSTKCHCKPPKADTNPPILRSKLENLHSKSPAYGPAKPKSRQNLRNHQNGFVSTRDVLSIPEGPATSNAEIHTMKQLLTPSPESLHRAIMAAISLLTKPSVLQSPPSIKAVFETANPSSPDEQNIPPPKILPHRGASPATALPSHPSRLSHAQPSTD